MDRRAHDYTAASGMPYAQQQPQVPNFQQQQQQQQQQQAQFGFHPQHQQYPSQMHGSPFIPPHPSLQQMPYHHPLQQQPQLLSRPPAHPQMYGQQPPSAFTPHLSPHLVQSPFLASYDLAPPPPPAAPPSDPELQKRIDKLVEYSVKNGPEFEAMIREKQKDNPDYSFLFGGEGHGYYRYKLWISSHPPAGPFNHPFPPSSMPLMHHPPNPMLNPNTLHAPPQIHQPPFPPFHEPQQHLQHAHPFGAHARPDHDQSNLAFKGLSGPLPSDVAMELNNVLINLNGTKESIKSAKIWFMQRSPFSPALTEALRDRVFAIDELERQLHIMYLANDILFDCLQRRTNQRELDNVALAFKPVLGSMLARIYHNPQNKEDNQSRLQKILEFWASKEVYDRDTICALENEMKGGPPAKALLQSPSEGANSLPASVMVQQPPNNNLAQWQFNKQGAVPTMTDQGHNDRPLPVALPPPVANQQFLSNAVPSGAFPGSMPINSSAQPPSQLPAAASGAGEKLPPYPLFPPGLIPGMVRKMQIGSGVPYSPLSPLDIPTVIPPSDVPQSEILERVSKFFKEIGEVNPCEGPMRSDAKDDYEEYERESPPRKGGACIPPPPDLQVDPETGTYADGSVDRKPGLGGSGRLGLGATANPNEPSQYDDVYTSYRKQRSTNYHSSMSARATTR